MHGKPRRSVDGIAGRPGPNTLRRPAATPQAARGSLPRQPQQPNPAPHPTAPPPRRLDFTAPQQPRHRRRWWQSLLFPCAILVCLSASFVVQSLPLGMAAIAVYGIVAWARHIPSRVSFIMAFLALLTVVILLVVRQNVDLASNFATYAFLLLVVGIASTMLESRIRRPKHRRSKIPHLRA
ncbi:MAG TPA: hypothetical protein VLF71_04130 [Candidatus Saccharimonadales bacterium]|nr:hypothetical protein [Candidatus Saccharimonadales bacterium]